MPPAYTVTLWQNYQPKAFTLPTREQVDKLLDSDLDWITATIEYIDHDGNTRVIGHHTRHVYRQALAKNKPAPGWCIAEW